MKTLKQLIHQWRNKAQEVNTARLSHDKRRHELSVKLFEFSTEMYRIKQSPMREEDKETMLNFYETHIDRCNSELFWLEVLEELNINQ